MENQTTRETKIKQWYTSTYPTDSLGQELKDSATFQDMIDGLQKGISPYSVLGIWRDSIVRERVFTELAKILNVPYEQVYNQWLHGDTVFALKAGEDKPREVYFKQLRKNDIIFIGGKPVQVGVGVHHPSDVSYEGILLYDTAGNAWTPADLDKTMPQGLIPFRIVVTETFVREVEIYAESAVEAQELAEELCNEGDIDLNADDFVSRETHCRGVARDNDLELHEVFDKDGPVKASGKPALADQIRGAQSRTVAGQSKAADLSR